MDADSRNTRTATAIVSRICHQSFTTVVPSWKVLTSTSIGDPRTIETRALSRMIARIAHLLPFVSAQLRFRAAQPQVPLPSAAEAWSAKERLIATKIMVGSAKMTHRTAATDAGT